MKHRFFFAVFFLLFSAFAWADSARKILSITHNSDHTYTVTYQMVSGRIVTEHLTKDQLEELRDDINDYNNSFYSHEYFVGPIPPPPGPRINVIINGDDKDDDSHNHDKERKHRDGKEHKPKKVDNRKNGKDDFRMYYKDHPKANFNIRHR